MLVIIFVIYVYFSLKINYIPKHNYIWYGILIWISDTYWTSYIYFYSFIFQKLCGESKIYETTEASRYGFTILHVDKITTWWWFLGPQYIFKTWLLIRHSDFTTDSYDLNTHPYVVLSYCNVFFGKKIDNIIAYCCLMCCTGGTILHCF